jgi:hypothetical protein
MEKNAAKGDCQGLRIDGCPRLHTLAEVIPLPPPVFSSHTNRAVRLLDYVLKSRSSLALLGVPAGFRRQVCRNFGTRTILRKRRVRYNAVVKLGAALFLEPCFEPSHTPVFFTRIRCFCGTNLLRMKLELRRLA